MVIEWFRLAVAQRLRVLLCIPLFWKDSAADKVIFIFYRHTLNQGKALGLT